MSSVNHVKSQLWKYQLCYDSDSQAQLCQFQLCKYQLCARLIWGSDQIKNTFWDYPTFKDTIIKVEESPRYTITTFISDVGGILGIFLGLSFWSMYGFVAPMLQKLAQKRKTTVETCP